MPLWGKASISEKQLGRKIGKHAADFGLDPANAAHRAQLRHIIEEIRTSPDRVVKGTFRGQGSVQFFVKGEDIVVTTPANDFITILKGGVHNPAVRRALEQ
jgi:filamentous hemagglutinin